jgi:hypothetical protein
VLIAWLREYSGKPKPDVDWQYSNAKKKLKEELLNPSFLLHMMTVNEIWNSRAEFEQYPMFLSYQQDRQM